MHRPSETFLEQLMKKRDDKQDETGAIQKYAKFIRNVALVFVNSANKSIIDDELMRDAEDIIIFEKSLNQVQKIVRLISTPLFKMI